MYIADQTGKMPTKEEVEAMFGSDKNRLIKIELDHDDWREYEGNINFDHVQISWNNSDDVLHVAGYNGYWELMHPEKLNEKAFYHLVDGFTAWIMSEYDEDNVELWEPGKEYHA